MTPTIDDRLTPIIAELLDAGITLRQIMTSIERKTISLARMRSRGNTSVAAQALGVHRNTLINRERERISETANGFEKYRCHPVKIRKAVVRHAR